MAKLPIITGADTPVLRAKAKKVGTVTKEILKLIKDMEDTVDGVGIGLAAPQIGQSLRLCLATVNGKMTPFIDPEVLWRSDDQSINEEGCLSLPNITVNVPRPNAISIRYLDAKGKQQERTLEGWDAIVVQHELDHLDGVLIVDYINPPKTQDNVQVFGGQTEVGS